MKNRKNNQKVAIVMGSQSDYSTMQFCEKVLKVLKIKFELNAYKKDAPKHNIRAKSENSKDS